MNWLYYIAEANLYLVVFYLAYCLFLSKETHYQLNRGYLLTICMAAFTIPVIQLGFLMPVQYLVLDDAPLAAVAAPAFTWADALFYLYIAGVVFFAARFVLKLYQLKKLIGSNTVTKAGNYTLVSLPGADTAFSFFNYLFVGSKTDGQALITRHELVHIRQKHSVDIVFVELIQIISWFNPAVYLLQNSLKTVHEYVADEQTAATETDTIAYATYLLNNAYGISGPAMTHSFFNYNLLKKRITMLHQKRSGNLARLKYLIAAPLCMGLLYQSTFGFDKTYGLINIAPKAPVIVQANTDTVPAKPRTNQNVNVEPILKEKVEGLNIQNAPKGTVEQVVVTDKNGDLVDIRTKKGKAIQAENIANEGAAKGYIKRTKGAQPTESSTDVPAANVDQLLDGKVKGYIIRTREPKTGSSTTIDENGKPATDAPNKEPKVKGINIQNNITAAVRVIEPQQKNEIPFNGVRPRKEVSIDEPLSEVRINVPQQKNEAKTNESQSEIRIDEPTPVTGKVEKVTRIPAKNGRPAVTVTDIKLDKSKPQQKRLPPPPPEPPKAAKGKQLPPP
ncbi:MAG: M56 family metallopeptidase, partial [Bacteroidota bacterium]